MNQTILSAIDQRRLERLAAAAGRSPKSMLKHVLRDGFDYCEYVVNATNKGLEDVRACKLNASADVRRKARETIARHAAKQAA